jgi:hypothetical protein
VGLSQRGEAGTAGSFSRRVSVHHPLIDAPNSHIAGGSGTTAGAEPGPSAWKFPITSLPEKSACAAGAISAVVTRAAVINCFIVTLLMGLAAAITQTDAVTPDSSFRTWHVPRPRAFGEFVTCVRATL